MAWHPYSHIESYITGVMASGKTSQQAAVIYKNDAENGNWLPPDWTPPSGPHSAAQMAGVIYNAQNAP